MVLQLSDSGDVLGSKRTVLRGDVLEAVSTRI